MIVAQLISFLRQCDSESEVNIAIENSNDELSYDWAEIESWHNYGDSVTLVVRKENQDKI